MSSVAVPVVKTRLEDFENLSVETANALATNDTREKVWVIREGANDWVAWWSDLPASDSTINRATSSDGRSWSEDTTNNPVIDETGNNIALQDPGVVIDENGDLGTAGTYYLYCEDATNADNVRIYTSSDGISWTHQTNFSTNNAQSPVPIIRNGALDLIYEHFTPDDPHPTGHATSTDGTSFTDQGLLRGGYVDVPQSVFNIDGQWYLILSYGTNGNPNHSMITRATNGFGDRYSGDLPIIGNDNASCTIQHNPDGSWLGRDNGTFVAYGTDTFDDAMDVLTGSEAIPPKPGVVQRDGVLASVPTDSLEAYYPLDQGSGVRLFDASGNWNHGYLINSNSHSWTTGVSGNALHIDGSAPVPQLGMTRPLGGNDWTIGVFVKSSQTSQGFGSILGQWALTDTNFDSVFRIRTTSGNNYQVDVFDGSSVASITGGSVTNSWKSLFVTWDTSAGQLAFYEDATSQGTATNGAMDVQPYALWLANNLQESPWTGDVDEIYVYIGRVLPQSEIQAIHNKHV